MDLGKKPSPEAIKDAPKEEQEYLQAFEDLYRDKHGVIRWKKLVPFGVTLEKKANVILLPRDMRTSLMKGIHDQVGHRGREEDPFRPR